MRRLSCTSQGLQAWLSSTSLCTDMYIYVSIASQPVMCMSRRCISFETFIRASSNSCALAFTYHLPCGPNVSSTGQFSSKSFTSDTFTVISAAISMPVPHSSASPMVACTSPICSSAPGTRTGKYIRVPFVISLLSRLPPCAPTKPSMTSSPSGAVPMTPIIGSMGNFTPLKSAMPSSMGMILLR